MYLNLKQYHKMLRLFFVSTSLTLIVAMPLIFLIAAFFTYSVGLSYSSYDNWRIEQVLIMSVSILLYLFHFPLKLKLSSRQKVATFIVMTLITILLVSSIYFAKSPLWAILDLLLMSVIVMYLFVLSNSWLQLKRLNQLRPSQLEKRVNQLLALTSLAPLFPVFWCIFGHYLYIADDLALAWHGAFANIRFYNDTLLPCLFLLWLRPSFLQKYPKSVTLCASLYLLTLWIDGARAVLLGITIALLVTAIFYRKSLSVLVIPIASIALSLILYVTLIQLLPNTEGHHGVIIRDVELTSGRLHNWTYGVSEWLKNPVLGIGGANFMFYKEMNFLRLGHIHNIVLQLVLEWGLAGIIFIATISYLFIKSILLASRDLPAMLFAGAISLATNSTLAGAYIYPQSQLAMLIFFSYLYYRHGNIKVANSEPSNELSLGWIVALIFTGALLTYTLSYYPTKDVMSESYGPRFWQQSLPSPLESTQQTSGTSSHPAPQK